MRKLDGSEQVWCVERSEIRPELIDGREPFVMLDKRNLVRDLIGGEFRPRTEDLESGTGAEAEWLQVIPYSVVVSKSSVFTYRRGRLGTEARLHGKTSIGLGGHLNSEDAVHDATTGTFYVLTSMMECVLRELQEEINVSMELVSRIEFHGLLFDPHTAVGRRHLGIVCVARVEAPKIEPAPEIDPLGFLSVDSLIRECTSEPWTFEPWSRILVPHLEEILAVKETAR